MQLIIGDNYGQIIKKVSFPIKSPKLSNDEFQFWNGWPLMNRKYRKQPEAYMPNSKAQ